MEVIKIFFNLVVDNKINVVYIGNGMFFSGKEIWNYEKLWYV